MSYLEPDPQDEAKKLNTELIPYDYRTNAITVRPKKKGPLKGIIRLPVPHDCVPPGFLSRYLRGLNRRAFLWRCKCGLVYRWGSSYNHWDWHKVETADWVEHGGREKEE